MEFDAVGDAEDDAADNAAGGSAGPEDGAEFFGIAPVDALGRGGGRDGGAANDAEDDAADDARGRGGRRDDAAADDVDDAGGEGTGTVMARYGRGGGNVVGTSQSSSSSLPSRVAAASAWE